MQCGFLFKTFIVLEKIFLAISLSKFRFKSMKTNVYNKIVNVHLFEGILPMKLVEIKLKDLIYKKEFQLVLIFILWKNSIHSLSCPVSEI